MTALALPAPAKLNLFLHITGRRPDGYHTLQTAFQFLDAGDTLHLAPADTLSLDTPGMAEPPETNLVWRAARALQDATGHAGGAALRLDKRLPVGGGLGGGSSDAATALLGLNRLWGTDLSRDALAELGLTLGADVPVFVHGRAAWAEGVGERLTPLDLPEPWYLVLAPDCAVSTARVFARPELTRDSEPLTIAAFLDRGGRNDCEATVRALYPDVDAAMAWLNAFAPARLTGTGSCVFAAFSRQAEADAVFRQRPDGLKGFVARGQNRSPLHQKLGEL